MGNVIAIGGTQQSIPFVLPSLSANEKQASKFARMLSLILAASILAIVLPTMSRADDSHALTELFTTTAFSGSWSVFSKFNWLGKLLNFFISAFCLIGLVLTVFRVTITLLYKSAETLFDQVHDLKSKGKGQKFFGIQSMGRELFNGNYGTGLDVIIGFVLSLLPDIKAYSDYNPDKPAYNLEESDTITTYLLKISLPTIMTILFFSLGFSGTLWQAYGNVVDAMAVAAEKVVQVDLAGYVNKALNAAAFYQFSFNTKDPWGKFQHSVATSIYNRMLLKSTSLDTATIQTIGSNIETWVKKNVQMSTINNNLNMQKTSRKITEKDTSAAVNLTSTVDVNSNRQNLGSGSCVSLVTSIGTFGVQADKAYYVHVTITKKANADETNYFSTAKSGNSNNNSPSSLNKDTKINTN